MITKHREMSEEFGESEQNEPKGAKHILQLVDRYEEMVLNNKHYFFDSEQFEDIIDYYIDKNNPKKSLQVIEFAIGQYPFSTVFFLRKAQILAATNQSQKALEILSFVESMEPSNAE
ncbi:MAG: tetratricopeptide repeat protein [Bacteroidetes bacterium]|nr:tetratricopeptide repeat protein [Bacteroidota bacterium]